MLPVRSIATPRGAFLQLLLVALFALPAVAEDHETASHRFEEVAPGVYFVSEVGSIYLMSNAMVIVNEDDVLVVDSHVSPMAGRALLQGIETFTDKPITTLVNTHYHFDHAHGNQVFGEDVEIIGHEFTREKLAGTPLEEATYKGFMQLFDDRLAAMTSELDSKNGEEAVELEKQVKVIGDFVEAQKELAPRAPTVTLTDRMTLFRGTREIQVHFFGRGHTGGDVVVFLPEEKILFTGDLLLPSISYMGDGHVDEWSATLEKIKALEFETIVPGHGRPFQDRSKIGQLQDYYGDLWEAVVAQRRAGASAEEAAMKIDLTRHADLGVAERGADLRAVLRIFQLLEERGL